MLKKVHAFINEYQMLEPKERVIAACSGGADSVCLLSVLQILGMDILAVHVHHGLRGKEADGDANFVGELCRSLEIPFRVVYADVTGYAVQNGLSLEEAGRILRYRHLEEEAGKWGAKKIAVAHHKDDNAETILYHLLRGSGLRGLGGMRPVQGNRIRPLLCVDRREIEAYLQKAGMSWCEDSTNQSDDYTRNRMRNQILPMLTEKINTAAVQNILHGGEVAAQADDYLCIVAEKLWEQAGIKLAEETKFPISLLEEQPSIVRTYVMRLMLTKSSSGQKDISFGHYEQMEHLVFGKTGSELNLPGGLLAVREAEYLVITGQEKPVLAPELVFTRFVLENHGEIPKNRYTKWLDYDRIEGTLCVRTRKSGDFLSLPGGKKKTIARYMIDEKIPRRKRDQIYLLAEGNHILWMIGYRISEYYKITNNTKTILQVSINGGENHGE